MNYYLTAREDLVELTGAHSLPNPKKVIAVKVMSAFYMISRCLVLLGEKFMN